MTRRTPAVALATLVALSVFCTVSEVEAAPSKAELIRTWRVEGSDTLGSYTGTIRVSDASTYRVQLEADLTYTDGSKPMIDVFMITAALMIGTAGLPHVNIRFFTVKKVRDARLSAGYALLFIAILYTTAPAVAAFARYWKAAYCEEETQDELSDGKLS